MRGRGWKCLAGVLALLLLVLAVNYFLAESGAIGWHLRHGFHTEMNGLRFKVPLLYEEDHGINMLQLSFSTTPGHINKKMAFLSVDFHKQPPAEADSPQRTARLAQLGIKESAPHPLRLAGHDGTCIDLAPLDPESSAPITRILKGNYEIRCTFADDLHVTFWGTANARSDFYAIMQSAESVKGKT